MAVSETSSAVRGGVALGEYVQADVAARLGPLVVLPGQDGADEADQGVTAAKMPTTSVRRRVSLLRRSFIRPSWGWQAGWCCVWSAVKSDEMASEGFGDAGVAGGVAVPASGFGVCLQVLDLGELVADGVAKFGPAMKLSQVSQTSLN